MADLDFESPVLVCGFPRSGTSLIAGLLAACGLWTGECVEGGKENPRGFFENKRLREHVVKGMLRELDADPLGIQELPKLKDVAALENIREWVREELKADGYKGGPWLFKDCKLTLLWPAWRKAFPNAKWIIVRRNELDIISSCRRTHFMRQHSVVPSFWSDVMRLYFERLEALANDGAWWREAWPQNAFDGEWSELQALCDDLGLEFDTEIASEFLMPESWRASKTGEVPLMTHVKVNVGHEGKYKDITPKTNMLAAIDFWKKQVKAGKPWKCLQVWPPHDGRMAIVGGGPSLRHNMAKLREEYEAGTKIVAVNATHDFLIKGGIVPWAQVMIDARPENAEFVKNARDDVFYLIASQCHINVFKKLKDKQVVLWHSYGNFGEEEILTEQGLDNHMIIAGGCTSGIKMLNIGVALGFRTFPLFGMDCSYEDDKHHAYDQSLNDKERTIPIIVPCADGDKRFTGAIWMARQLEDFQQWVEAHASYVRIEVDGCGGALRALADEAIRRSQAKEVA